MERQGTSQYVDLGLTIRYLIDVNEGQPIRGRGRVLHNLEYLLGQIDDLGLAVTQRLAVRNRVLELHREFKRAGDEDKLSQDQRTRLEALMLQVREVVLAETEGKVAFVVSDMRWDVEKLLDDPAALFAPGVFVRLPEFAQHDYREAALCVAFARPTAAAFHLMRGTESILRAFYCSEVKRNRVKQLWGPMVEHLRARSKPPPKPLLDQLDAMRVNFRNPTQHPDAIYDIQEAQDLLGLAIDVANRINRAAG